MPQLRVLAGDADSSCGGSRRNVTKQFLCGLVPRANLALFGYRERTVRYLIQQINKLMVQRDSTPVTAVSPAGTNGLLNEVAVVSDSISVFENMNSVLTVLPRYEKCGNSDRRGMGKLS